MTKKLTLQQLNDIFANEATIREWYPNAVKVGAEWVMGDVQGGKGNSFKINLNKVSQSGYRGAWQDFSTGEKGYGFLTLYASKKGITLNQAITRLSKKKDEPKKQTPTPPKPSAEEDKYKLLDITDHVPPDYEIPKTYTDSSGIKSSKIYEYRELETDDNGRRPVRGCVVRWDYETGGKTFRPLQFSQAKQKLVAIGFKKPTPLYMLRSIERGDNLIIVEGEKCVEAANKMKGYNADTQKASFFYALTWSGGSSQWQNADWGALKKRKISSIALLPDNDAAGVKAMRGIVEILKEMKICDKISLWEPTDKVEPKFDVADWVERNGTQLGDFVAFIKDNYTKTDFVLKGDVPDSMGPTEGNKAQKASWHEQIKAIMPFIPLGYDEGTFHFFSHYTGLLIRIPRDKAKRIDQLTKLAHYTFWEQWEQSVGNPYHTEKRSKKSKDVIDGVDRWLLDLTDEEGYCDAKSLPVRGNGVWIDEGRVVINGGKHLIVDGKQIVRREFNSEFLYQVGEGYVTEDSLKHPLTDKEGNAFLKACCALGWQNPTSGILLAGWCAIAPFAGALGWRSHIWITGQAGSGKSSAIDKFVRPATTPFSILFGKGTTPAGIEDQLQYNSPPIIMDEAESRTQSDRKMMSAILDIARLSSFAPEGTIVKKHTKTYMTKAMFCMVSIVPDLITDANMTRFCLLKLRARVGMANKDSKVKYENAVSMVSRLSDSETPFSLRLFARFVASFGKFQDNLILMKEILMEETLDSRSSEQLAPLITASMMLFKNGIIPEKDMRAWLKSYVDIKPYLRNDEEKEQNLVLAEILTYKARVNTSKGNIDVRIANLIELAVGYKGARNWGIITKRLAEEELKEWHIRLDNVDTKTFKCGMAVVFAKTATNITNRMSNSVWGTGWAETLESVEGARTQIRGADGEIRPDRLAFYPQKRSAFVAIALDAIIDIEDLKAKEEEGDDGRGGDNVIGMYENNPYA